MKEHQTRAARGGIGGIMDWVVTDTNTMCYFGTKGGIKTSNPFNYTIMSKRLVKFILKQSLEGRWHKMYFELNRYGLAPGYMCAAITPNNIPVILVIKEP